MNSTDYRGDRQPVAEAAITAFLKSATERCAPLKALADKILSAAAVRLRNIIDYINVADAAQLEPFVAAGWIDQGEGVRWSNRGVFGSIGLTAA